MSRNISRTKSQIVEEMSRSCGISEKICLRVVNELFDTILFNVGQGHIVKFSIFGSFKRKTSLWRGEKERTFLKFRSSGKVNFFLKKMKEAYAPPIPALSSPELAVSLLSPPPLENFVSPIE